MSYGRFASITADLLARKGEAKPWDDPAKKPLAWDRPAAAPTTPATPATATMPRDAMPEMKKCTVRISYYDYERLGILAVKENKTRQRLLQEAVDGIFTGMTQQFGSACRCLGTPSRD